MAFDRLPWGRRYVKGDPVLNVAFDVIVSIVPSLTGTRASPVVGVAARWVLGRIPIMYLHGS